MHWDARLTAEDVGYKAIAVSVSDLAAVGARPRWAVLSISLTDDDPAWVGGLARGLSQACARWGVYLLGGDTTRSPTGGPRMVSVTLAGSCAHAPLTRAGGLPGDRLWVTGTLGLAGAGWRLPSPPSEALSALRRPQPPLALALALAEGGAVHAAMDLSDGLATDLPRLCRASGTGARVDPDALPVAAVLADHPDRIELQLASGDDFELLLAAPPEADDALRAAAAAAETPLHPIGILTDDGIISLVGGGWPAPAFTHFSGGTS